MVCGALAGIKRSVIFHFNLRPVLTLFKIITIIHSQLTVSMFYITNSLPKEGKKEEREEEGKKLIRHYQQPHCAINYIKYFVDLFNRKNSEINMYGTRGIGTSSTLVQSPGKYHETTHHLVYKLSTHRDQPLLSKLLPVSPALSL